MDLKTLGAKTVQSLKKYKYAALVLLLGILLMAYPSEKKKEEAGKVNTVQLSASTELESQLSEQLSRVNGAGKVKVILSLEKGEETVYQMDENSSGNKDSTTRKRDTVTVDKNGLIKQINPPVYKGAIVLCQGADSPQIRLAMVDAVSKITGLGADCISVLKMN